MKHKIKQEEMGRSQLGWLNSWFHFSFAEYYNPDNMNYGKLRVINDDVIQPHTGFSTHPHRDMEIITYVVDGELTHGDSMKNQSVLHRGEVQYMSAGTGIFHSEMNNGDEILRLLQIWILPDKNNYPPQYGEKLFPCNERLNNWMPIASGINGNAPIKLHQDMNIFASELTNKHKLDFTVLPSRQAYLVLIEGNANVDNIELHQRDAMEIDESFQIVTDSKAHIILFEMEKA